jgi:hypothetical protein
MQTCTTRNKIEAVHNHKLGRGNENETLLVLDEQKPVFSSPAPQKKEGKFGSIPLKDHHFRSIPLLSHLHVGTHESMTCGVYGIYLKFGSFNGIDPNIVKRKT